VTNNRNSMDQGVLQAVVGRWFEALTYGSQEIVLLLAADGSLRYVSQSPVLGDAVGYDATEVFKAGMGLVHEDDRQHLREAFAQLISQDGCMMTSDYRIRHRLGHWVRVQSTAVNRLHDEIVAAVVVHTRPAPVADVPSGSPSGGRLTDHALFVRTAQQAVDRARREPSYGFSVLAIELERLKMLVGSYGQQIVNQLLGEVGNRISSLLRPQDTLGRLSGGEFAILLDGVSDRRAAGRIADSVQKTVGLRYEIGDHVLNASTIIGISTSERAYEHADDVLRDAALASNRARGKGRKRRAVFQTQMRVEDTRFMAMVAELHNALHVGQFRLHYQPIVCLNTGRLRGLEALIRWQHPNRGLVSPGEFIPVAEETGLIAPIGRWVLSEACRQMAAWHQAYPSEPPVHVSVNLSAKQFGDEDLSAQVETVLGQSGLDARQLKLEITESAVLENHEAARQVLTRLKDKGIKLSLDDFGTGYSSFSYLYQLPYDTLKIDRSFVSRICDEGQNTDVIHAIIVLAHKLGMDVVAEGVETATQASQLRQMGCEYAQGNHFASALEGNVAGELMARRSEQSQSPA